MYFRKSLRTTDFHANEKKAVARVTRGKTHFPQAGALYPTLSDVSLLELPGNIPHAVAHLIK